MSPGRCLVFTDLDGTLLDHGDYTFQSALPALERIQREGWPLIMVTSKTRPEVEELQGRMGLVQPFVVENGGGIFFPSKYGHLDLPHAGAREDYRVVTLGRPYREIRSFLQDLPEDLSVRGFGDMSPREVQEVTGLPEKRARMARAREFTEPFLPPDGGRLEALQARAREAGLTIVRGGRFFHLMDEGQDKGRAVRIVRKAFEAYWNESCKTVGLGDSRNDLPMLQAVDVPVVVPNPDGSPPEISRDHVVRARKPGSAGWNEALQRILDGIV